MVYITTFGLLAQLVRATDSSIIMKIFIIKYSLLYLQLNKLLMKNCIICDKELQGLQQKFCSNNCKQKSHYQTVKEQTNSYHSQTKRGYRRKLLFIQHRGGECEKCGYNKNISSLDFHHKKDKSFQLDLRHLSNNSMKVLYEELCKCILLCSNCHRELHNPETNIENIYNIVGDSLEKSKDAKWMNSVKPKLKNTAIPSQAENTFSEGVETSGEVKPS